MKTAPDDENDEAEASLDDPYDGFVRIWIQDWQLYAHEQMQRRTRSAGYPSYDLIT